MGEGVSVGRVMEVDCGHAPSTVVLSPLTLEEGKVVV